MLNWQQIEGKWDQLKGSARQKWAKLSDDDLERIRGRRDELVGRLREIYGMQQELAEKEVEAWRNALK